MSSLPYHQQEVFDTYHRLSTEYEREIFKRSYLSEIRYKLAMRQCPDCGVKHLIGPTVDGWYECPLTSNQFRCS